MTKAKSTESARAESGATPTPAPGLPVAPATASEPKPALEPAPPPGLTPPESLPLDPYRQGLRQLGENLERLRTLQRECQQLAADQAQHQQHRQELLAAIVRKEPGELRSRAELEGLLQQLSVKQEINAAELDYTQQQLEFQEQELQQHLMHTQSELDKLWRSYLQFTHQKEVLALEQCVHPEFRQQQRLMIEQLVMISVGVIECRKLEPTLHSLATTYLYDTPAYKFSEQRPQTVRMMVAETERMLAQSEQLLAAVEPLITLGLAVPVCQPFEFKAPVMPTEFPQAPEIDFDELMHYEPQAGVGTTLAPAPMPPPTPGLLASAPAPD